MKKILLITGVLLVFILAFLWQQQLKPAKKTEQKIETTKQYSSPLMIESQRQRKYPGSDIKIEEELGSGENYKQYIASYKSDGLKIFALLTIPTTEMPKNGYPAVIFNHGYIPPEQYRTNEKYVAYVDGFAKNGYVVFKPDYRGHGSSEGKPEGAYYSPAYTTDVLNAVSSVKKLKEINPGKIGMWGHSMGGNIALRALTISHDIKAAVIWSGVVGSYEDLFFRWRRSAPFQPSNREVQNHISSIRQQLVGQHGEPNENSEFWQSIDPYSFIRDISAPIQLHQGLADDTVPPLFPEHLKQELEKNKKTVEYYTYEGADHNLSQGFNLAMQRSVEFFDKYLKVQ